MSNKIQDNNHLKTICMNYFNKDLNYFYYDFAFFSPYLFTIKELNISEYIPKAKEFVNNIIINKNIPKKFNSFINKLYFLF